MNELCCFTWIYDCDLLLVNVLTFQGFCGCIFNSISNSTLIELFKCFDNNGSDAVFVCSRHERGLSLHSCGPSPHCVSYCILQEAPFFSLWELSIKAVLKLIVCILPPHEHAGKILVSTVDTLLHQYSQQSLKDYNLSNLGPVHEKTPMNICCHPLRVETWMLQPLTGERTQVIYY